MSVLIRGLRMPDGCGDCPFCSKPMYNKYGYAYYQCDAPAAEANGRDTTGKILAMYCNGEKESFPNFCPLVEEPDNRWIPVTERLPEVNKYVLGYFKDGSMTAVCFFGIDEHMTFWRACTDEGWEADCDSEPTHWMPLPEPPKEE